MKIQRNWVENQRKFRKMFRIYFKRVMQTDSMFLFFIFSCTHSKNCVISSIKDKKKPPAQILFRDELNHNSHSYLAYKQLEKGDHMYYNFIQEPTKNSNIFCFWLIVLLIVLLLHIYNI